MTTEHGDRYPGTDKIPSTAIQCPKDSCGCQSYPNIGPFDLALRRETITAVEAR
jgi:hypothetical protein